MTNIIKQTLIDRRTVIGEELQILAAQKNDLILEPIDYFSLSFLIFNLGFI